MKRAPGNALHAFRKRMMNSNRSIATSTALACAQAPAVDLGNNVRCHEFRHAIMNRYQMHVALIKALPRLRPRHTPKSVRLMHF